MGVLRPERPTGWAPRGRAAVAVQEPLGHLIHDVAAFSAELGQAGEDLVGERAEGAGQVAADVPLEPAPLPLLAVSWGQYRASHTGCSQAARVAKAARLASLRCAEPLSRTRKTSRPVAAWRASRAAKYWAKPAEPGAAPSTSTRPRPSTSTLPETVSRRLVPAAGRVGCSPRRCQTAHRYGLVSRWVSSWWCSS